MIVDIFIDTYMVCSIARISLLLAELEIADSLKLFIVICVKLEQKACRLVRQGVGRRRAAAGSSPASTTPSSSLCGLLSGTWLLLGVGRQRV